MSLPHDPTLARWFEDYFMRTTEPPSAPGLPSPPVEPRRT